MYSTQFTYHLSATIKYSIIATCKSVGEQEVYGLSFKFVNDEGETVRVRYDRDLFEDIEADATSELLDDYYNGWPVMAEHH